MVVDEEIYRRLPTLLIATVDKFAQMPWNGRSADALRAGERLLRPPRLPLARRSRTRQSHPKTRSGIALGQDASQHTPLRPPDLIIQDELHLISGPLGTLVGLYETAMDQLCTWEVERQEGPAQGGRLDGDDPQGRRSGPRACSCGRSTSSRRTAWTSATTSSRSNGSRARRTPVASTSASVPPDAGSRRR